jgi:hypothetical protein
MTGRERRSGECQRDDTEAERFIGHALLLGWGCLFER